MITKFSFCLILIVVYFMALSLFLFFKKSRTLISSNFPKLKLIKSGIVFHSTATHKLRYKGDKLMLIGVDLYMKTQEKLIIFHNVKDVKVYEGFLYFTALGEVKICFDCEFFKYFAIKISSDKFSLNQLKQQAILNFMNCEFNLNLSVMMKKYLKILKDILKINITNKGIQIKPNEFRLPYELTYKVNNTIKTVKVNQIL